jgi:hypothetical protein
MNIKQQSLNKLHELMDEYSVSRNALSKKLKVTQPIIGRWLKQGHGINPKHIIPLCSLFHFKITPHEINENIYPNPDDGLPADFKWLVRKKNNTKT